VAKIPKVVEGAIALYLYDFHFEREVEMGQANRAIEIKVGAEKGGETQPSLKKPRIDQGEKRDNTNLQIEVFSSMVAEENVHDSKQVENENGGDPKDDRFAPLGLV
jgi:hypothetical protein